MEYRFAESTPLSSKAKIIPSKFQSAFGHIFDQRKKRAVSSQEISIKVAVISNSESAAQNLKMEMIKRRLLSGAVSFFGKGIGYGTQSKLRFLPQYQTGLHFRRIRRGVGFAGVMLLFSVYALLSHPSRADCARGGD